MDSDIPAQETYTVPSLASLPSELQLQIALHLSLYDVVRLSSSSRRLRTTLKNPSFGRRFLDEDARNLRVEVVQSVPIGGLDGFEFGIVDDSNSDSNTTKDERPKLKETTYFVHHRTPDASHLHTISVRSSGAIRTRSRLLPQGPLQCTLTPLLNSSTDGASDTSLTVTPQHRKECPLCSSIPVRKICYWIDKRYRVFFQSWADAYEFAPNEGVGIMRITLVHQEDAHVGWNAVANRGLGDWYGQFVKRVVVYRYGLLWRMGRGEKVEVFFGLREKKNSIIDVEDDLTSRWRESDVEAATATGQLSASLQLWNPWG